MRQRLSLLFICTVATCGLAAAQATVVSGYVDNWTPPGSYAEPFVPLVSTPSIALGSAPLVVGASNGTAGNVAGASNAAGDLSGSESLEEFSGAFSEDSDSEYGDALSMNNRVFQSGVASSQDSYGVAQLLKESGPPQHAAKTYTNADVARLNDTNGLVKFGGKTEQVN